MVTEVRDDRACTLLTARETLYQLLVQPAATVINTKSPQFDPNVARIANTFSRFAETQQTAYDNDGEFLGVPNSLPGSRFAIGQAVRAVNRATPAITFRQ